MLAIASFLTFWPSVPGMSCPLLSTGEAAPMFVPGAMRASAPDSVMKVPALAARPPDGATHTAVGTVAFRRAFVMSSVESRRPPGVLSSTTSRAVPSPCARCTASLM